MSEEYRTYFIDFTLGIEYTGEEMPCEETLLTPIKNFIKTHMKAYKNTCRVVVLDSKLCEAGYEEMNDEED